MIRLYIFTMFTFTPYYETSPTFWEVLANSMYYFWRVNWLPKGMYYHISTLSASELTSSWCYTKVTCSTLHYGKDPQGSPWYCTWSKVLTCSSLLIKVRQNLFMSITKIVVFARLWHPLVALPREHSTY